MNEAARRFLAMAALAVFTVAPAAAQETQPPSPDTPPIRVEGDVVYDNNVAASSAALAAARGIARADQIYTPSLDVNYLKELGRSSFYLVGSAGYDFYQRNTILNRERLSGQGGLVLGIDDCQGTLQGSYARHQSDLQDLSVITTKNTEQDVTGGLQAACNRSGRLIPSLSVIQTWSTNSAPILFSSNYRSTATQGSILYKDSLLGEISLLGQYTQTEYPHRFVNGAQQDGYKLYAGGVHVEHHFGSEVDFLFSISETSLNSNNAAGPDFDGITYDSAIAYNPTSRLQTKITFSRQTNPSNRLDASYSIAEAYGAEADYRLMSRLLLKLGASDTRESYQGAALRQGIDLSRETTKSVFGSLGFDINPDLAVTVGVTQDQRHADVTDYSYSSTQFSLTISQAF